MTHMKLTTSQLPYKEVSVGESDRSAPHHSTQQARLRWSAPSCWGYSNSTMEKTTPDAFVNREEPIPVILLPGRDATSSDSDSKRQKIKDKLSGSKLKHKLQDAAMSKLESKTGSGGNSLQDRLFAKYVGYRHYEGISDERAEHRPQASTASNTRRRYG